MVVVALFAYQRRRVRGAWYLTLLCLSGAVWAMFEGMRYIGLDLETDRIVTYAQYLGVVPIAGLTLLFSLTVFGYERWVNRSVITLFIAVSGTFLVLVWTDPLHHLVYSRFYMDDSGPFPMRAIERGILWWIVTGYLYLLSLALGALLIRIMVTTDTMLRAQAGVILAALFVVLFVNLIYVTGNSPVPDMDISPLSFIVVAISMAWGFFRYNLLNILPIARAEIFQRLSDPVLVLDRTNHILDLNPAAESLLEIKAPESIGRNIADIAGDPSMVNQLLQYNHQHELRICREDRERYFNVSTSLFNNRHGELIGRIITLHDNTERKLATSAERERERLQGVLEMAGAVCHDLSQPVMAILGYVELILDNIPQDAETNSNAAKLTHQTKKLRNMTKKLMGITRYETKVHQGNQIIDIERASSATPSDTA